MNVVTTPMFGYPIGYWHKSFVFWPQKTCDGRMIFMQKCYRRRIQKKTYLEGPLDQWWQYATYKDHAVLDNMQLVWCA